MRKLVLVGRKAPDEEMFTETVDATHSWPPLESWADTAEIDWDIVQKITVVQSSETAESDVK